MADLYPLLRPILFSLDPERSHDLVLNTLATLSRSPWACNRLGRIYANKLPALPTTLMGIDFPNPVGLSAGLDKKGNCANAMAQLGFGWLELGTVTPRPQPGNSKPRMFRLASHHAIINRMGFNSVGLDAFLENVKKIRTDIVVGINIGKNASTPIEHAPTDYLRCLEAMYLHADYITVNVSSPNTSNLRSLQEDEALDHLLRQISVEREKLSDRFGQRVPLVLKIAPDLDRVQIAAIAQQLRKHAIDGVAATNTTLSREAVQSHPDAEQQGGLSGAPIREKATQVVHALYQNLQGEVPIIGIGGVDSADAAIEKLEAGASLIQLYTGFIFRGPRLLRDIVGTLEQRCGGNDFSTFISELHQQHA